ncbi:MAG: hypothetical protein AB7I30_22600, partial [Isosphaeraceae bacterium]
MDPNGPTVGADLENLNLDALRRAVEVYLREAYPTGEPPPAVRRRLEWTSGISPVELLNQPPFERSSKNRTTSGSIYSLRLGNLRYPHMKLQIQPWPNRSGFRLSVNTHDQVLGL